MRFLDLWLTPAARSMLATIPRSGAIERVAGLLSAGRLVLVDGIVAAPRGGVAPRARADSPPTAIQDDHPKAVSWIKFQVVHHRTGEPYAGVRLSVRIPSGLVVNCETGAGGMASIDEIDPGVCDAWCELKGARRSGTVKFVSMGGGVLERGDGSGVARGDSKEGESSEGMREDGGARAGRGREGNRPLDAQRASWIAHIVEHKVQTGETLKSIAEANAFTWQELAEFNWETRAPDEINRHLRDEVGCTVKTPDGYNYRFTSGDDPGLLYIPRPWHERGMATEQTHVIRVGLAAGFLLILENEEGMRIPEAGYEATLADGTERKGRLGRGGVAMIKDPPPGRVEVRYPDLDDVEAKSLAGTVRRAFDERNPMEIHRLFRYPRETIQRTFAAYDAYYNDYHGQGLRHDIETEFYGDPDVEMIFYGYFAKAGMAENAWKEATVEARDG